MPLLDATIGFSDGRGIPGVDNTFVIASGRA